MGRKLPEDPAKRRSAIFKRLYRQYFAWQSMRETGEVDDVLVIEGVDYYLGDLLVGLETLPPQQRKSFELICLYGYTESAATEVVLPNSLSSTPVQQYSDDGLKKMIMAYDAKQAGTWNPDTVIRRRPARKKKPLPSATTRKRQWNWSDTNEEHQALADYINSQTNLGITPSQIKAVAFLRKEWASLPETLAARQRRKEEREALKAKYAYETPEQHEARLAAQRTLAKHQRAMENANKLMEEMKKLRVEAGLDPETGEPMVGQ